MDNDLRWASAVTERRLRRERTIGGAELRAVALDAIDRLGPLVHAVEAPLFDRPGDGVPTG